jgi:2-C-methyl-D-erythritol 2,4-cyclodiphosphate synthase
MSAFAGFGFDVHRLVPGRKLVLGGVAIPFKLGLDGHSDADVLIHAVADALLGAAGLGDIGDHFPDSDPSYKDASSLALLGLVEKKIRSGGFKTVNIDCTLILEEPVVSGFKNQMKENIARVLSMDPGRVNIKATTSEGLGFAGRGEGIAACAAAGITSIIGT